MRKIITDCKLRYGYVFTGVCDSVHRVGHAWQVCVGGRGVCVAGGGHAWQGMCVLGGGVCVAGEMTTILDSTHPTGIHSCFT